MDTKQLRKYYEELKSYNNRCDFLKHDYDFIEYLESKGIPWQMRQFIVVKKFLDAPLSKSNSKVVYIDNGNVTQIKDVDCNELVPQRKIKSFGKRVAYQLYYHRLIKLSVKDYERYRPFIEREANLRNFTVYVERDAKDGKVLLSRE